MTATNKLAVVHGKKRTDGGKKLRMENNLERNNKKGYNKVYDCGKTSLVLGRKFPACL